jgi:rhodanese-related sulfurtransferase
MTYTQIRYSQLRDLLADGAQLVEVLPPAEYDELHLPGAINIPLKTLTRTAPLPLTAARPLSSTAGTASET